MKILFVCSALDLTLPYSSTPAWWQLFKGLWEIGVEVVASPYAGRAMTTLWWRSYPNPCQWEGALFRHTRDVLRRAFWNRLKRRSQFHLRENIFDRAARLLANAWVRPKWGRHISCILGKEQDIKAVIFLSVPPNQLIGLANAIRARFGIPVIYFDGDVPASLPDFQGFATGFKIYQGARLSEFDAVICNSQGGSTRLQEMGAKAVHVLHYGADPAFFAPLDVEQDIDVFFYGHGAEYREEWIRQMIAEPSRAMPGTRFAVRGTALDVNLGRAELLPYMSLGTLREYSCRSKINLCITRKPHATIYASSSSRPFELAAMGCCIVSNPYNGLEEWFEPGKEIFVVGNTGEAIETYRRLLTDEKERRVAGQAARARVLREHTYQLRAQELMKLLESVL
jgi:hypothetical protein